ncbi:receptor-binding cancer antigen expressed on SiSo cells [Teleopsis dalmanni]|uniref:receptor-binding cancer antigen expressed on SiSo cells n=1 Tax=Teleopsis dalmanni TaxID=139649 RepID=UPI0018CFCA0F|nr:receptor-binding cancer antigen expressed on SiSo cells [Teleopsis dalmanni]
MFCQQIKIFLLSIVAAFRRALCCIRRRKPSISPEPIHHNFEIIVDSGNAIKRPYQQSAERDWNSWDDAPRTVEEHIEQYRQRIAKPPTPQKEEPEPDFFTELTPVIKPQPIYYLGDDKKEKTDFSRLAADKTDVPIAINADLEDWVDESNSGGWEEIDTEQTKQLIRDTRRELRYQRQKTNKPNGIEATSPSRGIGAQRIESQKGST